MKKLLLLLILSFFSTISSAGYLDDWTDADLCGWMDNPSPPEHIVAEVKKRGLSCGGDLLAASDSSYVLNAPKAEFYQRQYDMSSKVDQILSQRKTINPFLAWNYRKALSPNTHYGIAWTNGWEKHDRLFSNSMFELESPDWNYYYPNGPWSFWKDHAKQKTFVTNIDWDHDAEYGVTKAMNIVDPKFPKAFAEEADAISEKGFHGVMLDWWHIHHPIPWRGTKLENAMIRITDEIRKQSGGDFLLIGNTNWRKNSNLVSSLNGVFSELYKTPYSRSDSFSFAEIAEMEALIKFNEKHLRYPKLIAFEPWRITDKSDPHNRTSEENLRFARLYSAMATVIPEHGYILYGDNNPDFDKGDHDHYYYDVYSVDLGKPVSKYTAIAKGVAYKKFEDGYIAFNRLEYDVTVNFGDFQSVIPSMDAVFLKEDGTPYEYTCEEGFLKDDICMDGGLKTYRYENGEIKSEENYKDGKLDGKRTSWYVNGQIESEGIYKDNVRDGERTTWYYSGEIKSKENYNNGKLDGKRTTWHKIGQIESEGIYKDNRIDGKRTTWYFNGQIQSEQNYKDGKKEGKSTNWYVNGQIESEGIYKDNRIDGKRTTWYSTGQIKSEETYQDNKREGRRAHWYLNGQIEYEENYKNGKLDGKRIFWKGNGQIKSESNYKDGKLIVTE